MSEEWKAEWLAKRARQEKQQPEYRLALDIANGRDGHTLTGPHFPFNPSYGARSAMRWQCSAPGCEYWTGYQTKTKASKMILAHCRAKNAQASA